MPANAGSANAVTPLLAEAATRFRGGEILDDLQEAVLAVERAGGVDRRLVRHTAIARFSLERMLDDYERVFELLIGIRGSRGDEDEPIPAISERRTARNRQVGQAILEPAAELEAG